MRAMHVHGLLECRAATLMSMHMTMMQTLGGAGGGLVPEQIRVGRRGDLLLTRIVEVGEAAPALAPIHGRLVHAKLIGIAELLVLMQLTVGHVLKGGRNVVRGRVGRAA